MERGTRSLVDVFERILSVEDGCGKSCEGGPYTKMQDIPPEMFELAERPRPGSQAQTRVKCGRRAYPALLDSGASCPGVPAEILV